jgi:hypothetical protein
MCLVKNSNFYLIIAATSATIYGSTGRKQYGYTKEKEVVLSRIGSARKRYTSRLEADLYPDDA